HESRRIDNQLKGRAGRQGSPGETQFFLSLDDEVMRLFGGDRLKGLFDRLGVKTGQAVSDRMLDKAISSAQKKIEGMHFDTRKNTTKYDGVLNVHRNLFYKDREAIVGGADVPAMLGGWAADEVDRMIGEANLGKRASAEAAATLWSTIRERFQMPDEVRPKSLQGEGKVEVAALRREVLDALEKRLGDQKARFGDAAWGQGLRDIALDSLDEAWYNHLENMQLMQSGIGLEAYAQKDPWIAYQERAFEQWNQMKADVATTVVRAALAA
ncbi:MAG: preprotein translocase subunit SecA, partial [Proteobacteria bacterium]|nr:preprotein translocase subunit SecA [Pseudomonadota bacterium]